MPPTIRKEIKYLPRTFHGILTRRLNHHPLDYLTNCNDSSNNIDTVTYWKRLNEYYYLINGGIKDIVSGG